MTIPRWSMIGIFVAVVAQFILSCFQSKKTRKDFREVVLANALLAAAVSIIFVREFFNDLPLWIDAPVAILVSLSVLFVLGHAAVRLTRYLRGNWRLEPKNRK